MCSIVLAIHSGESGTNSNSVSGSGGIGSANGVFLFKNSHIPKIIVGILVGNIVVNYLKGYNRYIYSVKAVVRFLQ